MKKTKTSSSPSHKQTRAEEYLSKPYARIILPEEDGSYRGEIMEFPGCIAAGRTAIEALENLENAAESWIMATLDRGQSIPQPVENTDFSGKLVLRFPKSLHKQATRIAEREGVSLNQFIVASIAMAIGERHAMQAFTNVIQQTINFAQLNFYSSTATGGWTPMKHYTAALPNA